MCTAYVGDTVKGLILFYKPILKVKLEFDTVYDQIVAFGIHSFTQFQSGDFRSIAEFNNYNPKYSGTSIKDIISSNPSKINFLETAANCFGFKSLDHASLEGNAPIDIPFEQAVDMLLDGNMTDLQERISEDPTLLTRNSQYGHKAGLIHYIGSNGVEFWRQVVPNNLVDILKMLLDIGADPDMWNNIYGSSSTLKGLIETSVHPYKAGLNKELIELL